MTTKRLPRTVDWKVVEEQLGAKRTEELMLAIYGPEVVSQPLPKVSDTILRQVREVLTVGSVEGRSQLQYLCPAIFRRYFGEKPQARANFLRWIAEQLNEVVTVDVAGGDGPEQTPEEGVDLLRRLRQAADERVVSVRTLCAEARVSDYHFYKLVKGQPINAAVGEAFERWLEPQANGEVA